MKRELCSKFLTQTRIQTIESTNYIKYNQIVQFWLLGAGARAAWKKNQEPEPEPLGKKNQEPEPEPLEKKVRSRSRKKICWLPSPGFVMFHVFFFILPYTTKRSVSEPIQDLSTKFFFKWPWLIGLGCLVPARRPENSKLVKR